jgi:50S ribosomal subunit-associated GTPase HflX
MTTALATRHGSLCPSVEAVAAALGLSVSAVVTTDAPEDNEFHLPPGTVDRVAERVTETEANRVVIDGIAHPGQMDDLGRALPPVDLADRRDLCYEWLAAGTNPAAETALALRKRRIERRTARRQQRDTQQTGPTGESGTVSDLDRACDQLATALETQQNQSRQRIETSYQGVDGRAVVVGPVGAATTTLWESLTESTGDGGVLGPAEPRTAVTTVGPAEVAVTDTPGLAGELPAWFTAAVPGTMAAIERADLLVVVTDADDEFSPNTVRNATAFDGTVVTIQSPERGQQVSQVTTELSRILPTTRLSVTLPYTDGAESLISRLYDEASVETVSYGERIEVEITVSETRRERIEGLIADEGGTTVRE